MKARELKMSMDHKIETTRFGNTTLHAEITLELQSPVSDTGEIEEAIKHGTDVIMSAIASKKAAIDKAEADFFIVKSKKELMNV